MSSSTQPETYRDQLLRLTRALAMAECEAVAHDLSADSRPLGVKLFVDGNLDKRFEKLRDGLEFVAPAFKKFDDLVVAYIRSTPLAAYDTGASDSERLLQWLVQTRKLSPRQQDYIACQRARHAVEEVARAHRLAYVRFQERWSVSAELVQELPAGDGQLYLNPVRVATTLRTRTFLGDDADVPAPVLFFAVAGEISSAALDERGQQLLTELQALEPVSLASWQACTQAADADELLETVQDLAGMGLIAVA